MYPNGTLIVEQTQRGEDAGTYTCQASNRQRHAARRDVEVQIIGNKHKQCPVLTIHSSIFALSKTKIRAKTCFLL